MPFARSFTEAQKRIVAARQGWRCSQCAQLLSAAFQVDHTVPLWDGGADTLENASGMCANCHAVKTQAESIQRAQRRREVARAAAEAAERARHPPRELGRGVLLCQRCGGRYYTIFKHACRERASRKRTASDDSPAQLAANPFARFLCTTDR